MSAKTPYRFLFALASRITDWFPRIGARFINALINILVGNRLILEAYHAHNRHKLSSIKEFRKILVISDLNIGDAVTLQAAISAFRDFYPESSIDYCVNRYARPLVEGNHEIAKVWPIFTGTYVADHNDITRLKEIIALTRYDLIVNFCPFFDESRLSAPCPTIRFSALAFQLIRDLRHSAKAGHIVYQAHRFIYDLMSPVCQPQRPRPFRGVSVTIADSAIDRAKEFLSKNTSAEGKILFLNPDASSEFTRVPFECLLQLLKKILELNVFVLVGAGHTDKDIGSKLIRGLPRELAMRSAIVPSSMPLDSYAALIDRCDAFISADTGPLHIAAARKIAKSGDHIFNNRTSIFSIFGATPARIYGYDSFRPGYFPSNQNAPSFSYASESPCRNISCINKMAKTCHTVRCFASLDVDRIVSDVNHQIYGKEDGYRRAGKPSLLFQ